MTSATSTLTFMVSALQKGMAISLDIISRRVYPVGSKNVSFSYCVEKKLVLIKILVGGVTDEVIYDDLRIGRMPELGCIIIYIKDSDPDIHIAVQGRDTKIARSYTQTILWASLSV